MNVDVVVPHGVAPGAPETMNLAPSAVMSVRVKSILLSGRHTIDTRLPRYACQEVASVLGATRTGGGRAGVGGSDGGGVVVGLGGTSAALAPDRTAAAGSGRCEAFGGPAESPASQATQ